MIINLSYHETIHFKMFEVEYTHTESYSQLHIDLWVHLSASQFWTKIIQGRETYVCRTSKASALGRPAFRYLHAILSRILTWKRDNKISQESIHIGHALACLLRHQSQDACLATIFLGPYITSLVRGLGLINYCTGMYRVGGMQPLGVTILLPCT